MMTPILDQPLPDGGQDEQQPAPSPILRYAITILLFPAALLRLRSVDLTFVELLTGGLWSSAQFLLAALPLTLLFNAFFQKDKPATFLHFITNWLRITVDLIVFVGVLQLLWQWLF